MTADRNLAVWAEQVSEAGWLVSAVVVPLAFNPWGQSSFELPKTLLLRAVVLMMGLAALVGFGERLSRSSASPRPPPAALTRPAVAIGLVMALATVSSVAPRVSLWGSYERQQGLLTLLAYLALFLITAANLRTCAQIDRLWTALVWGSAPVVIYSLVQATGLDPLVWRTDAASPVLSTIGRANFLGSYLVLVIPLTVARVRLATRRCLPGILLSGQILCLGLTQARGAWVGLGVAVVAGLLAWAGSVRDRRPALVALALALLATGFVGLLNVPEGPLVPLTTLPGLDRLASIANAEAGSSAARLTIWRATLPLAAARPWLGYGPETMQSIFAGVFPPQLVYYQGRDVAVDRAHNLWLDVGMSAGLAGVVSLGALLVGFLLLAWKGLRSGSSTWERSAWVALFSAASGHVADLQFGFELTSSATTFWLLLALGVALERIGRRTRLSRAEEVVHRDGGKLGWLPYLPPSVLVIALIVLVCVRPLLADVAYQRSLAATGLEQRLEAAARAVRWWPLEPQYRLNLAASSLEAGDLAGVEAQLAAAERLSPEDPRVWAAYGEIYAAWGELAPAPLVWAEDAYRRALDLAPNLATYHAALGVVLAGQGRLEEGVEELERAVDLDATYGAAYRYLVGLYSALGREADADWAQQEAARWSGEGEAD